MEVCDVLVVGGGPGGSSAAFGLRDSGLDVLVLDQAEFPRDKTCAGWVTPPVLRELEIDPEVYAKERTIQPITGFRIRRMGDREALVECEEPVSYGILRREFDQHLLERCEARLRLGERIRSIERDARRDRWRVNGDIEARILVGAGGHFCPVARWLRADEAPGETAVLAQEVEYRMSLDEAARCPVDPAVPELFFTPDLEGYGWIFRKGDSLNVGLGRRDPRGLSRHVADFVDFLCEEGRLAAPPLEPFRGHGYLLYDDAARPVAGDGFLLVGDALGLAYGRSGEGIRPAVESGLLAARTIGSDPSRCDAIHLDGYRKAVEDRFGPRGPRAGPGLTNLLPASWTRKIAGWLLASPRFDRAVVVDRWFLNARQPPLEPAPRR
jgi:geranylgeranyl reductase family protein